MASLKNWEAQARTNSILAGSIQALEARVDDCYVLLDWCVLFLSPTLFLHSRSHTVCVLGTSVFCVLTAVCVCRWFL